ncbi:hypothetical protein B0O99DRAFT_594271 [Bisporella sp. PMI_857]|nr:hypothetical protein B0O99DRAFT_594271 [Bisporella sp. PMI_857]
MSRGDKASIQFPETQLPATRSRASKGKSRSGCLPCKERRIKCSEEHPVCLRCAQQRRECVYESIRVPKWKEKTNVFSVVDGISSPRSSTSDDQPVNDQTTRNLVKVQQFEFVTESIGQRASEVPNGQLYGFSVQDKKLLDHFENFTSTNLIIPHRYWIREIIPAAFKACDYCPRFDIG